MAVWLLWDPWWSLALGGAAVGYLTDWFALKVSLRQDEMWCDERRCDETRCDMMWWEEMWWEEMWCDERRGDEIWFVGSTLLDWLTHWLTDSLTRQIGRFICSHWMIMTCQHTYPRHYIPPIPTCTHTHTHTPQGDAIASSLPLLILSHTYTHALDNVRARWSEIHWTV